MADPSAVTGWLDDFEIRYEEHEGAEGFEWAFIAHGSPFTFLVARRDVGWPNLYLQSRIGVSDEHREVIREIGDDDRDAFLFDLRIALASAPVGQRVEMDDEGYLDGVVLALNLLEDPVRRSGFMRRVHQIQSTGVMVAQYFQKLARFKKWPI